MLSLLSILLAVPLAVNGLATVDKTQTSDTIANQWLIRLEDTSALAGIATTLGALSGVTIKHQYSIGPSFKGFAINAPESVIDIVAGIPGIKTITPDVKAYLTAPVSTPTELEKRQYRTQSGPTYGLQRISARNRNSGVYYYDDAAGQNTFIYVIDSGLNVAHKDFSIPYARGQLGISYCGNEKDDTDGHGTHVAGTAAGRIFGVSKQSQVIAVKVFCSNGQGGQYSTVISAIQWVVDDAKRNSRVQRSVINMSLGGAVRKDLNDAVDAASVAGILVVVAAGNSAKDASQGSPGSSQYACVVGAIDKNDQLASYSNFGPRVNIFAPGSDVQSDWIGNDTATNIISGTSMASPHVAGLAAYFIGLKGYVDPAAQCNRIESFSTKNMIKAGSRTIRNQIAYNDNGR